MKTSKIPFAISVITATMFFASCDTDNTITVNHEISQTIQNNKADTIDVKTIITRYPSNTQTYNYSLASGEQRTFAFKETQRGTRLKTTDFRHNLLVYQFEITDSKGHRDSFQRSIESKSSYKDTKISETIVITD
jgi:hypothetical protein